MFVICMVCHGELVRLRPDLRDLTEFYLMLSAGGSLVPPLSRRRCDLSRTFLGCNIALSARLRPLHRGLLSCAEDRPGPLARPRCSYVVLRRADSSPCCSGKETSAHRLRPIRGFATGSGISTAWFPYGSATAIDPTCIVSLMKHGAILHGQQFVAPDKRGLPLNYYTPESGIGRAILCSPETG